MSNCEPLNEPFGRPKVTLDWEKIDKMLEAGCDGTEVAGYFGVAADTLYRHCMNEKGVTFSAYKQEKLAKGNSLLRMVQFQCAMEKDRGMLIWLGKNRLDQKDVQEHKYPNDNLLDEAFKWMKGQAVKA